MSLDKAIIARSTIYIVVLTSLTVLNLFLYNTPLGKYALCLLLLCTLAPILIIIYASKKKLFYLLSILFIGFEFTIFVLFFRKIRDALPPPPINENGIVGYSQFFGYPFFMDTIIFFLFIFSPFAIIFIYKLLEKYHEKNK